MRITLNTDSGLTMWFLGEPGNIKASLNYSEPGPIEINFSKLTELEQKKLLIDVQSKRVLTDTPYKDLYEEWSKRVKETMPSPSPQVQQHLQHVKQKKEEQKQLRANLDKADRERKFQEKCIYLSKKSARALKAAVQDEKDLRLFRVLRSLEIKRKKPRVSVTSFLDDQIRKLQKEVVKEIEDSVNKPALYIPKHMQGPEETIKVDVIESDQEVVEFEIDAADLADFAAGKPL